MESFPNFGDDLLGSIADLDGERLLRLLQIGQLTRQNRFSGKVSVAGEQALGDQRAASLQVNEMNFRTGTEFCTVGPLQGGTRQHNVAAGGDPPHYGFLQAVEPGFAILIGEGYAVTNLFHIRLGMEVIRIPKLVAELRGEQLPHCRFPGTHNPHDDDDHVRGYFLAYVF